MKRSTWRQLFAFAVVALLASPAYASKLVCSETVSATELTQFPATVSYELTVTEDFCNWCAANQIEWCMAADVCGSTDPSKTFSVVMSESDPVVESLLGAPIPWNVPVPPGSFPFNLHKDESRTTTVELTFASYADCATRARSLPIPVYPGDGQVVTIVDKFSASWNCNGVLPPGYDPSIACPPNYPSVTCEGSIKCVPPSGPTRTLGYFKTHPDAVAACLSTGPIDLVILNVTTAQQALGVLTASPAKYANGTKRSEYDQKRLLLARQLLVAECNGRVFGSSAGELIENARGALAWNSCGNMTWLTGELDAFNNSGDTGENWFGNATPMSYPDPTPKTSGRCQ